MSDLDLSPLAIDVAKWLSKSSSNGVSEPVDGDELTKAFSASTAELNEALAELELEGLASLTKFLGPGIPHIRPEIQLFVEFDPEIMGTDPVIDAAELAASVLEGNDNIGVTALHKQSGWTHRRFNPALSVLLSYVDERHVSETLTAEYPTLHFFLDATDRVQLKRFIRDVT